MSTYQELKGLKVKYLSSDTSGDRIKEGELFYNSTSGNLKTFVTTAAWHSGANLITARSNGGGAGTTTAGLNIGGNIGPSDTQTTLTEEYDGVNYSAGGTLPAARRSMASSGTQTAAIASGGFGPPSQDKAESFTYDGSSFTDIPSLCVSTVLLSFTRLAEPFTYSALTSRSLIHLGSIFLPRCSEISSVQVSSFFLPSRTPLINGSSYIEHSSPFFFIVYFSRIKKQRPILWRIQINRRVSHDLLDRYF